ncbi:O-antigen ligase family protein [Asticcacaulis excentricus]|uniref:O-antigen polymerase n=1 Tax=Asticcacaulis excentricus (strain ATCC 15261 / DSM 4724 / KCTC 12464 / NCIMB 9791 / VKM B-1370 / CB 48) TaxID=573065 RepID=E8RMA0_ASTEC|nr:O-antigen ligase family protein [Asticcacaulis excentricus]ADU13851.1 O-antigen polymerase [Asticcacaulis excentricus CB 48]
MTRLAKNKTYSVPEAAFESTFSKKTQIYVAATFVLSAMSLELQLGGAPSSLGNVFVGAFAILLIAYKFYIGRSKSSSKNDKLMIFDFAYLTYCTYTLITFYWSVSPFITIIASLSPILLWLCTYEIRGISTEKFVNATLLLCFIVAILSLASILVDRSFAFQPRSSTGGNELRGIFKHQLRLGAFMASGICVFVIALLNKHSINVFRNKFFLTFAVIVIAICLIMANARLYTVCAALSLLITFLLYGWGEGRFVRLYIIVGILLLVVPFFGTFLTYIDQSGFDTSLSGRDLVWNRTSSAIVDESRLLGYGYGTFDTPYFDYLFRGNYRPAHAHNSFLQALFETGIIGLSLVCILIVLQIKGAWSRLRSNGKYSYALFFIVYNVLSSLFGLNYAGAISLNFALMLAFLSLECRKR